MALSEYTKRQLVIGLCSQSLADELVAAIDADGAGTNVSDPLLWRLQVALGDAHSGAANHRGAARLLKVGVDDDSAVSDFVTDRLRMAFGARAATEIDAELGV